MGKLNSARLSRLGDVITSSHVDRRLASRPRYFRALRTSPRLESRQAAKTANMRESRARARSMNEISVTVGKLWQVVCARARARNGVNETPARRGARLSFAFSPGTNDDGRTPPDRARFLGSRAISIIHRAPSYAYILVGDSTSNSTRRATTRRFEHFRNPRCESCIVLI